MERIVHGSECEIGTQGRSGSCGTVYSGYNTFWGQQNWLRLTTPEPHNLDAFVRVYDLQGKLVAEFPTWIGPGMAMTINLQAPPFNLPPDTYGLIEVEHHPDTPGAIVAEIIKRRPDGFGVSTLSSGLPLR